MTHDLAALRGIVAGWRRAEHARHGGSRLARHLAILDLLETWRVERVGWGEIRDGRWVDPPPGGSGPAADPTAAGGGSTEA